MQLRWLVPFSFAVLSLLVMHVLCIAALLALHTIVLASRLELTACSAMQQRFGCSLAIRLLDLRLHTESLKLLVFVRKAVVRDTDAASQLDHANAADCCAISIDIEMELLCCERQAAHAHQTV
jgi:hypothetical protein